MMGRIGAIDQLEHRAKVKLRKSYKDKSKTLDDLAAEAKEELGDEAPSRTAIWLDKKKIAGVMRTVVLQRELAAVWVTQMGKAPDSDQGRLLSEMFQSMLSDAAMAAMMTGKPLDIKSLKDFGAALKASAEASRLSLAQADLIEKRVREQLLREQQEKLETMGKAGTVSPEVIATIRREVYGLTS